MKSGAQFGNIKKNTILIKYTFHKYKFYIELKSLHFLK